MPFLIPNQKRLVDSGHGIIRRDANFLFAEVSFRVRYGAPQVRRASENLWGERTSIVERLNFWSC